MMQRDSSQVPQAHAGPQVLALLLALSVAPSRAEAQSQRPSKTSSGANSKSGAQAGSLGAGEGASPREGAASFKVETAIDRKSVALGRAADQKRDEAIDELKKLIPKAPAGRKAEMIFRLAELYWEKSKYKYGLEMEEFERAYQGWNEEGSQGEPPKREVFLRESEVIKENALDLYEKVLTQYPTYERNDEVLFYLGYNEYEAANYKKAVGHYWTLIKQFPQSPLVPDAYLQLGEHFFNNNNVLKARKAYERALATEEGRVANYARYKLAWCDYNVQEYAAGIQKLKAVIDASEVAKDKKSIQLKGEALRDLARFFSYVDEVETAFEYFKKKGGEEIAVRYTSQLGGLYHEQGKWDQEIQTYRMLINKYPRGERAPFFQASIVEAFGQKNDRDAVRKEVERLVDLYRPGTPWYRAQEDRGQQGKAALEYAYDLTESKLRDMVTEYHRDAQKRKDVETYALARDIYAKYLDAFPSTESAYQMRYFYGEVLWALDEWKNAAEVYKQVALTPKGEKASGRFQREAAYNQILAWEQVAKTGKEKGDPTQKKKIEEKKSKGTTDARTTTRIKLAGLDKDKAYDPEPLPPLEKNLSEACDLYFSIADRKDPDLPAIKFKAAYLYYKHNQFVEAAKRYFEIIENWPRDDLSKKAANLILDSLNVQKEWDELAKYAAAFRDNEKLAGGDRRFKQEVQEILEGATYLSIQEAEGKARALADAEAKERALGPVAVRFEKFQQDFPESRFADKAIFSAVLIYNQADQLDHAIEAAELMEKKYGLADEGATPRSVRAKKGRRSRPSRAEKASTSRAEEGTERADLLRRNHFLRASFYERIADFRRAAELYESYYEKYSEDERAADALFNAGTYYQGLGETDSAIDKFSTYVEEFDKNDEPEVYWRVCELQEVKKDWKAAAKCFDDFKKSYKTASQAKIFESRYRHALALEKLSKKREAMAEYQWLAKEYPRLAKKDQEADGARLAGAHAAFELLEPEYKRYVEMKVTLRKETLLSKLKKAEELACVGDKCKAPGRFLSILTYGDGNYGICALTRMGQVYRNFADSIRKAPIPRNLTFDQQEIYRAELDSVALGPEEKGLEAFESALKKAYELNIYNDCTLTAQANLKELNPNQFPDLQKRGFRGAESFIVAGLRTGVQVAEAEAEPLPKALPGAEPVEEANAEAETAAGASE